MDIKIHQNPDGSVDITLSPSKEVPDWAVTLQQTIQGLVTTEKEDTMTVSKGVQDLVDQIAASRSLEASSAAALTELVNQSAQNKKQIDDLIAAAAAGTGLSAEDAAAIAQGAKDLADSAVALKAAVPTNVTPPAMPPVEIPPATPPV